MPILSKEKQILSDLNLEMEYSVKSVIGQVEGYRYIQDIHSTIYSNLDGEKDGVKTLVGTMHAQKLLIKNSLDDFYSTYEVFDSYRETIDYYYLLYEENEQYKEDINLEFDDILIIHRIEILPKFRGKGIVKYYIKDLINNFGGGVDLVIGKPYPLQYENNSASMDSKINPFMDYDLIKSIPFKDAMQALVKSYSAIGYKFFKKNSEYMCLYLSKKNKLLSQINLELFDE